MDGWIDGWMDGWMDRWMDGRTEGHTDRQTVCMSDFRAISVTPTSFQDCRKICCIQMA